MSAILDLVGSSGVPRRASIADPIACTVTLLTPMFIAGADNRAKKEQNKQVIHEMVPPAIIAKEGLRSASVKAALRFWWRAGFDPSLGLDSMARREAELFGSIADERLKRQQGQGLVVRTRVAEGWSASPPSEIGVHFNELSYLAYGCADLKGPSRPAVNVGAKAEIFLLPRSTSHVQEISTALERWLLFGNLGAKARRGWGSLVTDRWKDEVDLTKALERHLRIGDPSQCNWSTLFGGVVFHKRLSGPNWANALNELGFIFHQFRKDLGADKISLNGQFQQRPGKPYGPDHDRVANWLNGNGLAIGTDRGPTLPERTGFGLPLPMQFGREKPMLAPVKDAALGIGDRRASPLIFKIHRVGGQYIGLVTILGGRFLPRDARVEIKSGHRLLSLPISDRPAVLTNFAQCLLANGFTRITP